MRISDWSSDVCSSDLLCPVLYCRVAVSLLLRHVVYDLRPHASANFGGVAVIAAAPAGLISVGSAPGNTGGAQRIAAHGLAEGFPLCSSRLLGCCLFGGSFLGFFLGGRFLLGRFLFGEIGRAACRERVCQYV